MVRNTQFRISGQAAAQIGLGEGKEYIGAIIQLSRIQVSRKRTSTEVAFRERLKTIMLPVPQSTRPHDMAVTSQ